MSRIFRRKQRDNCAFWEAIILFSFTYLLHVEHKAFIVINARTSYY